MPRTPAQFEEIREDKMARIKQSALELFANNGYHATSISQIAKKINISKGLLYNYFESKEALLKFLFYEIVDKVMVEINPTNAEHFDDGESSYFVDRMFDVVIENPRDWKLYFQLMLQQEVMEILMSENLSEKFLANQNILFNYFKDHEFKNLRMDILHFSSVYKGFAMSYVFAPELFDRETTDAFKAILKTFFIKPKRKVPLPDMELDEMLGYLLL